MYSIVFHCRMTGGELQGHPLETSAVGFFAREAMPQPLAGAHRWLDLAFRAIDGEKVETWYDPPRDPDLARRALTRALRGELVDEERDDRHLAVRTLPRVADRLVVDEARCDRARARSPRSRCSRAGPVRSRRRTRGRPRARPRARRAGAPPCPGATPAGRLPARAGRRRSPTRRSARSPGGAGSRRPDASGTRARARRCRPPRTRARRPRARSASRSHSCRRAVRDARRGRAPTRA